MPQRLLAADSGPLIALGKLGLLHLPAALYDDVLVTQTVWVEVTVGPPRAEHAALHAAHDSGWLKLVDDPPDTAGGFGAPGLDEGERTALVLAQQEHCDLLIDERRGREAARSARLEVLGTLGVLSRARQLGLIGPVRPLIERLLAARYHLAPALVAHALSALGE